MFEGRHIDYRSSKVDTSIIDLRRSTHRSSVFKRQHIHLRRSTHRDIDLRRATTAVSRTLSVWTFSYVTNFRARRNFPSQRYIATPTVAFRRPLPVKGAPPRAFVLNKQNVHEQSYRTIPCTTLLVVRADSTLVLRSALHGRLFEGTPG